MNGSTSQGQVRVWDLVVRFGHWMLVACLLTAWFTEGKPMWLHSSAGYGIAIVLGFRLLWGVIGTRYARFGDFVRPPREALAYLKGLVARRPQHYLGHNPAGGLMIVALLLSLLATAGTGMALYDADRGRGPVAAARAWLDDTAPVPGARHKRDKQAVHFWEEVHEFFATASMLLVVLHIGGVVVGSFAHRENLVRAMVTGRKSLSWECRSD
jgi:cytochrome b